MMRFQISQFFCWDLATGAKIIGALGVLKHSLNILLLYLESIALYMEKDNKHISTLLFTLAVIFLFVGFVLNIINIVLSYRLFKINETNQLQDLTNWINGEQLYLLLFAIYFVIKIVYGNDLDFKPFARAISFLFDVYCYLCVMSLREDYRQRASLLGSQA